MVPQAGLDALELYRVYMSASAAVAAAKILS